MLYKDLDKHNHQDVCERTHCLRMKSDESIEDFVDMFLHLCCKIPEKLNSHFFRKEFKHLVLVPQHGETHFFPSSPTLADHEAPQNAEEEPTNIFVPCPPPFLVLMWAPRCGDHEAEKCAEHISNPSSRLSPALMDKILEWLRKHTMKTHSSIPQEDIIVHNSSIESDMHLFHRLSSTSHESLYHDSLNHYYSIVSCS